MGGAAGEKEDRNITWTYNRLIGNVAFGRCWRTGQFAPLIWRYQRQTLLTLFRGPLLRASPTFCKTAGNFFIERRVYANVLLYFACGLSWIGYSAGGMLKLIRNMFCGS
jgi:hypothetical protein